MSDVSRLSANIHRDFKPHFRSDLPEGSELRFGVSGIWLCLCYKSGDKNIDLLLSIKMLLRQGTGSGIFHSVLVSYMISTSAEFSEETDTPERQLQVDAEALGAPSYCKHTHSLEILLWCLFSGVNGNAKANTTTEK